MKVMLVPAILLWYISSFWLNVVSRLLLGANCLSVNLLSSLQLAPMAIAAVWCNDEPSSAVCQRLLAGVGLCFYLGVVATNSALQQTSVSMTHVVKCCEPLFSLALSGWLLPDERRRHGWREITAVGFTCVGVFLAIDGDLQWWVHGGASGGLAAAFASNLFLQLRNLLSSSEKFKAYSFPPLTSLLRVTQYSFICALGVELLWEWNAGWKNTNLVMCDQTWLVVASVGCFVAMHLTSFYILNKIQPIAHATLNCAKRAALIIGSSLYFGKTMTGTQLWGTAIVLMSTFVYSLERTRKHETSEQ